MQEIEHHRARMRECLDRYQNEADAGAWRAADAFMLAAGAHAAVATELRAMRDETTHAVLTISAADHVAQALRPPPPAPWSGPAFVCERAGWYAYFSGEPANARSDELVEGRDWRAGWRAAQEAHPDWHGGTPRPAPPAPWSAGMGYNAERTGWNAYFAGHQMTACPYPKDRVDLKHRFEEGWKVAERGHPNWHEAAE